MGEDLRRRAVAQKFEVCVTSVLRWVQRFRAHGDVRVYRQGGSESRIEPHSERIFRLLEERPEISGRALQTALAGEGLVFGISTVQRFLKCHGLDTRMRLAGRRSSPQVLRPPRRACGRLQALILASYQEMLQGVDNYPFR